MRKILYYSIVCLLSGLFVSSCGKDEDPVDYTWRNQNEAYFNALESNPDYKKAEIPGGPGYIYYKTLTDPDATIGQDTAKFTSVVKVNYSGRYINGLVFDPGNLPFVYKIDGSTFYIDGRGSTISSITGWQIALQNMREGEKWEICIPWTLAYGASGSSAIPGYTTLVFDIELEKIVQLHPLPQEET